MIAVYLDGKQLEVREDTSIGITVSVANTEDPISASGSYSQTIKVPRTSANAQLFEYTEQILSPDIFNHSKHTAIVLEDGVELIKGKAYLDSVTDTDYNIQVVGNEVDWIAEIRDKKINEIDDTTISVFREYELQTEEQRKAVFFALVEHGCWWQDVEDETVRRNWATYADLVPFVSLTAILRSIFKGYEIDAGTISEFLTRLYIVGQWRTPDNADMLAADNDFEVSCTGNNIVEVEVNGTTEEVVGTKITADNHGNEAAYCNIFDTADSNYKQRIEITKQTVNVGGEDIVHNILTFSPTEDAITAYKLRLKYSAQYIIKDNTPIFADTIHFGGVPIAKVDITDGVEMVNTNSKGGLNEDGVFHFNYTPAIPPLPEVATPLPDAYKRDFYLKVSEPQLYTEIVQILYYREPYADSVVERYNTISTTVSRNNYFRGASHIGGVLVEGGGVATSARIGLKTKYGEVVVIDGYYSAYKVPHYSIKYDYNNAEYVFVETLKPCSNVNEFKYTTVMLYLFDEVNTIAFDLQLLTPSYALSTLEPSSLAVGFSSSQATELRDRELLVEVSESSLSPKFNGVLPFESNIALNDIGGSSQAADVLKAIMQLFNLRIYSNSDTKIVHILPYSEFYNSNVVDWSDRIDRDKGIEISTIGDKIGSSFRLTYQEESAAVDAYNKRHKAPYLSWHQPLLNKQEIKEYELSNSQFTPPIKVDTTAIFPDTEWGGDGLLNFVDENTQDTLDNLESDYPCILVQVPSATADPTDSIQYVGATGILANYLQPNMAVTDIEARTTISFADVKHPDGSIIPGLHKYYDKQIKAWNYGKRITCYCRVLPQEIDSLRKAGTSVVDFRSRFKLNIEGEDIYCRLEQIENYEPLNATHKCTFIYFGE